MSPSDQESQPVHVAAEILDRYAGHYRLGHFSLFTVARSGDHLTTVVTGQRTVDNYAESETQFYAPDVKGRIRFNVDADGRVLSLTLEQHGHTVDMPRISAEEAGEIEAKVAEKIRTQTHTPGTEAALKHLIDGLSLGQPDYTRLSSPLADATREQLPRLKAGLDQLGPLESLRFIGVGNQGWDVYLARHERGSSIWRLVLSDEGTIGGALVNSGP
jgi:bla regulator protein blaR1